MVWRIRLLPPSTLSAVCCSRSNLPRQRAVTLRFPRITSKVDVLSLYIYIYQCFHIYIYNKNKINCMYITAAAAPTCYASALNASAMLIFLCYMLYVICYMLYLICYMLYVTCYMLHVMWYMVSMVYRIDSIFHASALNASTFDVIQGILKPLAPDYTRIRYRLTSTSWMHGPASGAESPISFRKPGGACTPLAWCAIGVLA